MPAIEITARFDQGFSWGHAGHGLLECRSHALRDADGHIWLIDPLDGEGLDAALVELGGDVAGVIVLLDRHFRASVEIAERHGARMLVPPGKWGKFGVHFEHAETYHASALDCPFTFLPVIEKQGQWIEYALWWSEERVLVVPEALGTASYYRSRAKEPLAVHPVLRVLAPPRRLVGVAPEAELLLVGHGESMHGAIAESIALAVGEARRELPFYALAAPRHAVKWARAMFGMGRSSC